MQTQGFTPDMLEGWKTIKEDIVINPHIYFTCFENGFNRDGKIWKYKELLHSNGLEEAKKRIMKKYPC